MSFPPGTEMFQFPGFASRTYVFSRDHPCRSGFPIRKSADQRLLAAPRGLSQRATSFIASQCQGIHQMPFSRLIQSIYIPANRPPRHSQHVSNSHVDQLQVIHCPDTDGVTHGDHNHSNALGTLQSSSDLRVRAKAYAFLINHDHGTDARAVDCIRSTMSRNAIEIALRSDLSRQAPALAQNLVELNGIEPMTSLLAKQALSQLSYSPELGPSQSTHPARAASGGPGRI